MKVKYAFNLGRVYTLSLAELFSVFESWGIDFRLVDLYREILIIETEAEIDIKKLQAVLGGTIKIMEVLDSVGRKKLVGPAQAFAEYFDAKNLKEKFLSPAATGKVQIGISLYPMARQLTLRGENWRLGLAIKKVLSTAGFSVRIVLPQREAVSLPSVVVTHEHLLEKGAEIDFLVGSERIYLGKTRSVQDFEDYGRRDYQRPVRSTSQGMLPPKVAQVMINLAQVPKAGKAAKLHPAVLDPFVGSGTVLQEAMIMGLHVVGSDISEKAVEAAEKNLLWIKNRYKLPPGHFQVVVSDVKDLQKNLPKFAYEAVVTEGTLGPAYTMAPDEKEIKKNFAALEKSYLPGLAAIKEVLGPGKRVVIALPAYRTESGYHFFDIIDKVSKLGYDVVDPLPAVLMERFDFLLVTGRRSIIYDRKDQFVSREIFILIVK